MNAFYILLVWLSLVGYTHTHKALPDGLDHCGKEYIISPENVKFLQDLTYIDSTGNYISNQEIFDSVFSIIDNAQEYILIDMFLFNSYQKSGAVSYRNLAQELTTKLIAKKNQFPGIAIDVITDPINTIYSGSYSNEIELLENAGINVIFTDLKPLRDSNPIYSSFWRTFLQWFGNSSNGGIFPHPFSDSASKVTARSYLTMLNFKANHRKVIVGDMNGEFTAIITSGNPHAGSAAHSNVAFQITGQICRDIYKSEKAVAKFSDQKLNTIDFQFDELLNDTLSNPASVQLLTENQIKNELMYSLKTTAKGDNISVAMFYLCERDIIKKLIKAAKRGVNIRIILDPNKDAFGYEKNGIPNRQVAEELLDKSDGKIKIRWFHTHGEQFHSKMVIIDKQGGKSTVILGSANLTRRNLNNYNLETNVKVNAPSTGLLMTEIHDYFDLIWTNNDGNLYTVEYGHFSEDSFFKTIIYRIQEFTGLCTF